MSTRDSIWLAESGGKSVHIYWELADRDIDAGQRLHKMVAPVYLAVDDGNADDEVEIRLPKEIAEAILRVIDPGWNDRFEII